MILPLLVGIVLPPEVQAPEVALSSARSEIVLNGPWRFAPATGKAPTDWGRIWVPGNWKKSTDAPSVIESGPTWKDLDRDDLSTAWIERTITIPSAWRDRSVTLDLARVSTDADVFLDGQPVGRVSWPEGAVDLTAAARFGRPQTLRLKIIATPDAGEVPVLMGVGQVSSRKADLAWRGVMGDVVLSSAPLGARVSDVFVQPSVRKNDIALDVELTGVTAAGDVTFTADMRDESGRVEKSFRATVPVVVAAVQKVRVAWPWADARRWDLGKPELYTLRLKVEGMGVKDDYAQTFGFRELWVEGRRFLLNGTQFRMRPTLGGDGRGMDEISDASMRALRARGFNIQEIWPENWETRGTPLFADRYADRADRLGWPLMGPSTHINPILSGWSTRGWDDPKQRADWIATYERRLRRYRNHPSILLWANSGNNFGNRDDQAPTHIGRDLASPVWKGEGPLWQRGNAAGREAYALLKTLDPTRPILAHQAGPISDVYAVNNYLNFIPLQEREEWLADWAKGGNMPFSAVEFGTPLDCSFFRGRDGFQGAYKSEPCFTEFAAIYAGPDAYRTETAAYRADIAKTYLKDGEFEFWMFVPSGNRLPAVEALQSKFVTNTWRAWRTWGISGGMVPWSNAHGYENVDAGREAVDLGPFVPGRRGLYRPSASRQDLSPYRAPFTEVRPTGQALEANNGPTLAWIAGGPEAFTDKSHLFRTGETIRKQVAVLNDTRDTQPYRAAWTVSLKGRSVGRETAEGTLAPGETRLVPVSAKLTGTGEGKIELDASVGPTSHKDAFSFRVSSSDMATAPSIALVDPVGKTRAMLRAMRVPTTEWNGTSRDRLVVVGREAFAKSPALSSRLLTFVKNGGRVVVMIQRPEWYTRTAGLRVAETVSRRVFPLPSGPFAGVDPQDMRDWRGMSTLKPPFRPGADVPRVTPDSSPIHGWRGSGRGGVSSVPIEKPHRSGWRALLQSEYAMAFTPLMDASIGAGKLTLCTLDLEDHAPADPGAARIARRMLAAASAAPTARVRVTLLGDGADAEALRATGVRFSMTKAPMSPVVVVGARTILPATVKSAFLAKGGKLVYLPRVGKSILWAGGEVPAWPELAGLDRADIQPKVPVPVPAGLTAGAFGRERVGKGVAIHLGIDPTRLDADRKTYLRKTRWNAIRTLSTVLANMGASFENDETVLDGRLAIRDWTVPLAGKWDAKITLQFPDGTHEDPGVSPEAARLLANPEKGGMSVTLPASFDELGKPWSEIDGEAVFSRSFDVPTWMTDGPVDLNLGAIDDFDEVWVNGRKVGGLDRTNSTAYATERRYRLPAGLLKAKSNRVAIRVWDRFGGGGFYPRAAGFNLTRIRPALRGLYAPDYRTDFALGDDPYRYFRW